MEANRTACKVCVQVKMKIHNENFANGDKKYVDENGELWNGRTCPQCHRQKQMLNQRKKRGFKNQSE